MNMEREIYKLEIDQVSPTDWHQHLQGFADASLYQTWSYGAARWGENNLSRLVFKKGAEIFGLAQLRIVRPPVIGSGIAYLRWGPVFHQNRGEPEGGVFRQIIVALQKEYVVARGNAL